MTVARIALDAMGGDGPVADRIEAAHRASADHGIEVVLVGDPGALRAAVPPRPTVAASEAVGMAEAAALAVHSRHDASIRVAMRLLAAGEVAAVVSAGSTGATLTAALLDLGRLDGVRRPVLAAVLPVAARSPAAGSAAGVVLADAGASPDVQPPAMVANAGLALAYARLRGTRAPLVGLLNVGTEPGKGNALVRASSRLLAGLPGFVGNVEPADVLAGTVDVVVTDGFTGNIFLKALEAVAPRTARPGAALLLGVAGPVLVAHGAAGPDDLVQAIQDAAAAAAVGVVEQLPSALLAQTGQDPTVATMEADRR